MATPKRATHKSLILTVADDDFSLYLSYCYYIILPVRQPYYTDIDIGFLHTVSDMLSISDYKYIIGTVIVITILWYCMLYILYTNIQYDIYCVSKSCIYVLRLMLYWTHQSVCIRLSVSDVDYTAVSYTEITHSNTADVLELQPLTLRNYVNSLEPYNPEVHGWRDTTPPVMRSVKHSERATQLVTAIRMSGLQDIEILGVPDGHS